MEGGERVLFQDAGERSAFIVPRVAKACCVNSSTLQLSRLQEWWHDDCSVSNSRIVESGWGGVNGGSWHGECRVEVFAGLQDAGEVECIVSPHCASRRLAIIMPRFLEVVGGSFSRMLERSEVLQ